MMAKLKVIRLSSWCHSRAEDDRGYVQPGLRKELDPKSRWALHRDVDLRLSYRYAKRDWALQLIVLSGGKLIKHLPQKAGQGKPGSNDNDLYCRSNAYSSLWHSSLTE